LTYKAKPQLNCYHGKNVHEGYIKILRASIFSEHTPDQIDRLLFELKRWA
jgi:hypothetical protein